MLDLEGARAESEQEIGDRGASFKLIGNIQRPDGGEGERTGGALS